MTIQSINQYPTFVELLRAHASRHPDKCACTFLVDGEQQAINLTYAQLDQQAQAIAALLQQHVHMGARALLVYHAGLEFVTAFLGCLYAGVVAIPTYPPTRKRLDLRLQTIAEDAQATIVLTTQAIQTDIMPLLSHSPQLQQLPWLATDNLPTELMMAWQLPRINGNTLAFLQYTSGSTSLPKGVMVSHTNLLYNEEMMRHGFEHTENSCLVSWLPLFHDMGLIGNLLASLYCGASIVLLSPIAFLQHPIRWLQAISDYRATMSGAPNFAYELCLQKITPAQRELLDLSSWKSAFNGAEPVRATTLERFAATFQDCGFRFQAFYPCYGMAETTLFISGGLNTEKPVIRQVDANALAENRVVFTKEIDSSDRLKARSVVGCGRTWLEQEILIVNPETCMPCAANEVGELWIAGQHVAQGYWQRPEVTQQIFQARVADGSRHKNFLRTGDLGFLYEGEVFITGRLKDVLIIRGRNHYPQDLELTVEQSHPVLRLGCCAAFTAEVGETEHLVVAQEIRPDALVNLDRLAVIGAIRQAVAEQHDLHLNSVVLLKAGTIPKTSSGKIQRQTCKAKFLANTLARF